MGLKFIKPGTILAVGVCLFLAAGCHSAGVFVGDEPTYRHEPPPRHEGGPPPWAPAHGYRAKHKYRYYPSSRVYYDTGRRVYFYPEGGNWQVSASLPSSIRIEVSDYVSLEMDTDEPYRYHSDVEKRHPHGKQKQKSKGKGKGKWD
jgi:hypothetical protein